MVVQAPPVGSAGHYTVVAPPGVTRNGQAVQAQVPGRVVPPPAAPGAHTVAQPYAQPPVRPTVNPYQPAPYGQPQVQPAVAPRAGGEMSPVVHSAPGTMHEQAPTYAPHLRPQVVPPRPRPQPSNVPIPPAAAARRRR
jgi:hypothetical protein